MSNEIEDKSVHDILMCVIGEALMEADASFMFGHDFSNIINKYAPILQHKPPTTEIIREDIHKIKYIIKEINKTTPFLGASHELVQTKLDRLEYDVCDDPRYFA